MMLEKKQLCDDCGQDTKTEAMRYFPSDTHLCNYCIYPILEKYQILVDFVKEFHKNPSDEFIWKARDLLKEIGELNDNPT